MSNQKRSTDVRLPRGFERLAWHWRLLGLGLLCANLSVPARAQVSAAESARRLKPAAGLEATLWASEPMVLNPTNIDLDSRGRVWVSEGLNYRLVHGRNDRFHRVEDSDKIKILEDSDGDGKADKVTVFADRIFPVPLGLAVEEHYDRNGKYTGCRVYVGNSPDLLVLEDSDGDDRADRRYPILTGFGGVDSDHGVHGMVLGLDGKLYFTQGDGCCTAQPNQSAQRWNFDVTDRSGRHVVSDQLASTLRANRDGTEFEVICDRMRNNYETCLNSFGNIFASDNDDDGNRGSRVIWAMEGGRYGYRTPGSPRHWGEDVPGNVPKLVGTGNGSPAGIMVYEGNLLPPEYFGGLLEADAGTRQINFFPLTRQGASFRTEYRVFLASDDPWCRLVDACAAPDGSVFVADWYDAGVGGNAFSDQTTGRIFRVAPKGRESVKVRADFATVDGLIEALKSPCIATADAARRSLIARGGEAAPALLRTVHEGRPEHAARAVWVLAALPPSILLDRLAGMMKDRPAEFRKHDPRLRELAVRILGRDCRENGKVEYNRPEARRPAPALKHLSALLPMVDDPDAGVRRELILALRKLPTDAVGEALRKLTASWDGRDRWYLEALGLALEHRESAYLASLFQGALFGDLSEEDLARAGRDAAVAVPPYFPVDRNEAFLTPGVPEPGASALSKSLGLAWRIHRAEVVPLLRKVVYHLAVPELQQAADDVLRQTRSPAAAVLAAEMIERAKEPARRRELLAVLARNLEGEWRGARGNDTVERVVLAALRDPETRAQGIALVASSRDARYDDVLEDVVRNEKLPAEERAAAVHALGEIHGPIVRFLDQLITASGGRPNSSPTADAAVRTIPRLYDARNRLAELITSRDFPLGLRREALKALVEHQDGGYRILGLARRKSLPDDLKTEAATLLLTHRDRQVRDQVAAVLPVPTLAGGRPLPPVGDLLRRDGDPARGRLVFTRAGLNSCASCHRVRGQGQWIGPDLSTIGAKYGKDELLRSILDPSAAVGLSFRALVLGLTDGRVISGLAVEDTPEKLVVKTADGQRVTLRSSDIEDRKSSDVSLMPEGLAQTMGEQELVDLLAYLSTLREPVSIVGRYHVIGAVAERDGAPAVEPRSKPDLTHGLRDARGRQLAWRRLDANAEGLADLAPLVTASPGNAAYAFTPVASPVEQEARLVVETGAGATVWLNGKAVITADAARPGRGPLEAELRLPRGPSTLLIRLTAAAGSEAAGRATLVTTFASAQPVSFTEQEAHLSARP